MFSPAVLRAGQSVAGIVLSCIASLLMPSAALAASSPPPAPAGPTVVNVPPSTPSPAQGGASFGVGPASAAKIDGRANFQWGATPGATLDDHVAVLNIGSTPLTLNVYAVDAGNAPDGSFVLQPKDKPVTDAGGWLTLRIPGHAPTVTVPARSIAIVPITLTVPRTASPGDHAGGIVASLTSSITNSKNVQAPFEQRVAVRVAIRVSGPLHPGLSVKSLHAVYHATTNPIGRSSASVSYQVVNTGNVTLGAHQAVSVSGLSGSVHATVADVPMLLPGGSAIVHAQLHGIFPAVLETAHVRLTPIVPRGDVDPATKVVNASATFWAVPWILLAIIVAIALVMRWERGRRRKRARGRHGRRGGSRRAGAASTAGADRTLAPTGVDPALSPPTGADPGDIVVSKMSLSQLSGRRRSRPWVVNWVVNALAGCMAVAVSMAGLVASAGTATAATNVPYTNPSARGYVGLCDANGQNVTHGSVYDKPFISRAVSSVAAPTTLQVTGRKATLFAFQPRQGADPSEWTGDQLTASSTYTAVAHPMAQATNRDFALSDFLAELPTAWQGMVELRMYYSAPNSPTDTSQYPTTDIKVTGTTWTVARGGTVSCTAGSATSPEETLPASNHAGLAPPQPLAHLTPGVVAKTGTVADGAGSAAASDAASTPDAGGSSLSGHGVSGPGHGALVLIAVALMGLLGLALAWRTRIRSRSA